jgi:hypothetical protein
MSQDARLDSTSTKTKTGTTGTTCTKTGLYKATDGRIEFVLQIRKGATFPAYPVNNTKTFWSAVGSSDANKTSYDSVLAPAGAA